MAKNVTYEGYDFDIDEITFCTHIDQRVEKKEVRAC